MLKERFGGQKIAVVGSSGFVGSYLTTSLNRDGFNVIAMVRKFSSEPVTPSTVEIGDVLSGKKYEGIFDEVTTVVYTVARTHRVNEENLEYQ